MLPDLRLTLTGALVLLIGACAGDSAAPDPDPEPPAILTAQLPTEGADSLSTLVSCRTQPVPATSKYIGSKGGDLWIGPHHLIVPQGALKTTVRITGAVVDTNVVAVELQPAGLQLLTPALLTLDYAGCSLSGNESSLHLVYVVLVGSTPKVATHLLRDHDTDGDGKDDGNNQEISGQIDHFSRYAVAF